MLAKEGIKILAFEICLIPFAIFNHYLAIPVTLALALTLLFFRDPDRKIGEGVVSPADGKIDYIEGNRMEIFLNVFDCHVNRSPVDGIVKSIRYTRGSKPPAFLRRENVERNEIVIENGDGTFKVVQMAGIFARRIICYVKEGERVEKGDKIGMIVFGSRVVLEVPEGFEFVKKVGERVKAGETVARKVCKD
ncbi:phosphatidylserine decarboxylase [Archaeoglobus sp.]